MSLYLLYFAIGIAGLVYCVYVFRLGFRDGGRAFLEMLGFKENVLDDLFFSLPENFDFKAVKIKSSRENIFYEVSPKEMTCTCKSFQRDRIKFKTNDLRRLCKHLSKVLYKRHAFDDAPEIFHAALQGTSFFSGAPIYRSFIARPMSSGVIVYFATNAKNEWIDVYAPSRRKGDSANACTGQIKRYGLNANTRKWAYGAAPSGAKEIKNMI